MTSHPYSEQMYIDIYIQTWNELYMHTHTRKYAYMHVMTWKHMNKPQLYFQSINIRLDDTSTSLRNKYILKFPSIYFYSNCLKTDFI